MVRHVGLLVALALCVAGCSIDRIEWESTGYAVEAAEHTLVEEHHVEEPTVECIQREVGGAVWECRAHAGEAKFECEVKAGPREVIHEVECKQEHEEEGEAHEEEAPTEGESAAEHGEESEMEAPATEGESTTEGVPDHEDEPAAETQTEPAEH
jgi:hypothetical protein